MVQVASMLTLIEGHKTAVTGDLLCVPGSMQAAFTKSSSSYSLTSEGACCLAIGHFTKALTCRH